MTSAEFAGRLEGARSTGLGKWQARCPAHADKRASLSVNTGDDGCVLVTCHAGCETSDIVADLDLSLADLFASPRQPEAQDPSATYSYRDERGTVLFQVVRQPGKRFSQRRPDGNGGWQYKLGGVRRVLYRLPELLAADENRTVFVVEGERDVHSLVQRGLVATCNSGGAGKGKWLDEYSMSLKGRRVVILPDNDKPGAEHADRVAKSLQPVAASVHIVELPCLPEKGDVSDWFAAGNDVQKLKALMNDARRMPADRRSDSFVPAAERLCGEREERLKDGGQVIPFNHGYLDDLCRGILPSDLVLIGARTGAGKTALAVIMAQKAAALGRQVYFLALEAEPREIERRAKFRVLVNIMYRRRAPGHQLMNYLDWRIGRLDELAGPYEAEAEAEVARTHEHLHTYYRVAEGFDNARLERLLREIRERADLIVIDHLHYIDTDDEQENRALKRITMTIRNAALANGKPVIVLAHLRKPDSRRPQLVPQLEAFHGSSDVTKIATRVVTLAPAYDQPRPVQHIAPTYVAVRKDRPGGVQGYVAQVGFNIRSLSYDRAYRLGRIGAASNEWNQIAPVDLPHWANSAVDAELRRTAR